MNEEELKLARTSGEIAAKARDAGASLIKPGKKS